MRVENNQQRESVSQLNKNEKNHKNQKNQEAKGSEEGVGAQNAHIPKDILEFSGTSKNGNNDKNSSEKSSKTDGVDTGSFKLDLSLHYSLKEKLTYTSEKYNRVSEGVSKAYGVQKLDYSREEKFSLNLKLEGGQGLDSFLRNANKTLGVDENVLDAFLDATEAVVGEGTEALDEFNQATDDFFNALEEHFGERGGFFDRAGEELKTTLKDFFESVDKIRSTLGQLSQDRSQIENSFKENTDSSGLLGPKRNKIPFNQAIKNGNYDNPLAVMENNIAVREIQNGKLEKAIERLEKLLEGNPDFAQAESNLGMAHFRNGDLDEAINHLEKSLEIDPENAITHYNLGKVYQAKGDGEKAAEQFKIAQELQPGIGSKLQEGLNGPSQARNKGNSEISPDLSNKRSNIIDLLQAMKERQDEMAEILEKREKWGRLPQVGRGESNQVNPNKRSKVEAVNTAGNSDRILPNLKNENAIDKSKNLEKLESYDGEALPVKGKKSPQTRDLPSLNDILNRGNSKEKPSVSETNPFNAYKSQGSKGIISPNEMKA